MENEGDANVDPIDETTKRQDNREAAEMQRFEGEGLVKVAPKGKKKSRPYLGRSSFIY